MYYTQMGSPFGTITLVGDEGGLKRLHVDVDIIDESKDKSDMPKIQLEDSWTENHVFFEEVINQLNAYFNGDLKAFHLKLNPEGTAFQKRVWQALVTIPFGASASYLDIAKKIGNEKASRAVGSANGKNPIPIIVPCHRIVGSNGKLTGFAYGLRMKAELLKLESQRPE